MATKRNKMPIEERAKQFMPFSPLNGLDKALRKKELKIQKEREPELFDDFKELVNNQLNYLSQFNLNDHKIIGTAKYFENNQSKTVIGKIKKIDNKNRFIVVDGTKITFDNLKELIF